MKITKNLIVALLAFAMPFGIAWAQATTSIPLSQVGVKVSADYRGDAIGIETTPEGARLRTAFQKLAGTVTGAGLVLDSTAENGAGSLRLSASSIGRDGKEAKLPTMGTVLVRGQVVEWARPGLVEEYSVSVDGLRQDFVVGAAPLGFGELRVELALSGASAEEMADGVKLTLDHSGRTLAYTKLHVTDAIGRTLLARLEVGAADMLRVVVDDADAVYPVRIDPTFSDANWVSLNPDGVNGANGTVNAFVADGSGNLYVGGSFTCIGSIPANRIAKWNGTSWSALADGMRYNTVEALVIDTTGNLYAGGSFFQSGAAYDINYIAKWNGTSWSKVGTGTNGDVKALATDVSGNIYAGGYFSQAGGVTVNYVAKWNGTVWSAYGSGMNNAVVALALDGAGNLHAGGYYTQAGGAGGPAYLAKWNGSAWVSVGTGVNGNVFTLLPDASGNLYAGGDFSTAGGVSASRIAKWNGTTWSALGTGMNATVRCIAQDAGGNIYAGGVFTQAGGAPNTVYIAKWNGSVWSSIATGTDLYVSALGFLGTDLYAGGVFRSIGGVSASRIAKWNGNAWSRLGSPGFDGEIRATLVSGSNLYVAGDIKSAPGGAVTNGVAKWNGTTWSALGSGMDQTVESLAVDGSGNLYASGNFSQAGGGLLVA